MAYAMQGAVRQFASATQQNVDGHVAPKRLDHLESLEAESIYILREAVAEFARPVMLYSIGKDSSVMLRLAQKAFFPGKIPFPLLHVDTSYKFPEMIEFRDAYTRKIGAELIVHKNQEALEQGANPFALGTQEMLRIAQDQIAARRTWRIFPSCRSTSRANGKSCCAANPLCRSMPRATFCRARNRSESRAA